MRRGDVVELDVRPRPLADVRGYILARATGRRVLNVGAAGGVTGYLPDRRHLWMHHALGQVAAELVGVDLDAEGVAHANAHGADLLVADCETMDLGRTFDVVVLQDVLEHMDSPARGLLTLARHLAPDGVILVTTPNPTYLGTLLGAFSGRSLGVYWDHTGCFFPENLQALCDRHGLRLTELGLFSHRDSRTPLIRVKSGLASAAARLFPRLHNSMLAVIAPDRR